jgi:multiple sugar transport system substrate-binding protein
VTSDGQMLYYRSDLLQQAGISAPPKTWSEMVDDCSAVRKIVPTIDCFGGQYDKYEGLTVNVATAIQSAGGSLVDSSGKVTVDTPEALAGLRFLTDGFTNGTIPAAAITWQEENGRQDFQDGNLLFMNNWAYVYALANATDGSSKVNGKFAISPIPGKDGLGTGTLGGHNYAVSAFAKNKATARDFIKFMAGESQQTNALINAASPPTIASLYDDPELVAKAPYLPVLKESIEHSVKRPEAVNYNEASSAIQKAVYPALQGKTSPEDALKTLQKTLTAALKN